MELKGRKIVEFRTWRIICKKSRRENIVLFC